MFNWENYGSYTTQLDSASFGQPVANSGNAYVPRSGQLGFRVRVLRSISTVSVRL